MCAIQTTDAFIHNITYNTRHIGTDYRARLILKKEKEEAKLILPGSHLNAVCVLRGLTPEPSLGDLPGKLIVYFDLLPF